MSTKLAALVWRMANERRHSGLGGSGSQCDTARRNGDGKWGGLQEACKNNADRWVPGKQAFFARRPVAAMGNLGAVFMISVEFRRGMPAWGSRRSCGGMQEGRADGWELLELVMAVLACREGWWRGGLWDWMVGDRSFSRGWMVVVCVAGRQAG